MKTKKTKTYAYIANQAQDCHCCITTTDDRVVHKEKFNSNKTNWRWRRRKKRCIHHQPSHQGSQGCRCCTRNLHKQSCSTRETQRPCVRTAASGHWAILAAVKTQKMWKHSNRFRRFYWLPRQIQEISDIPGKNQYFPGCSVQFQVKSVTLRPWARTTRAPQTPSAVWAFPSCFHWMLILTTIVFLFFFLFFLLSRFEVWKSYW